MCDALPSAYSARLVTARLVHRCYSCGFPIVRGEIYHHASGVWDGRGDDFRRHQLCAVLEERSGDHARCWTFGQLSEVNPAFFSETFQRAWATVMRRAPDCLDYEEGH